MTAPTANPSPNPSPAPAPAPLPDDKWFWCPRCALVASKPGTCASCREPYQPAPPWGIPFVPRRPPPAPGRKTSSVIAIVTVSITIVALVFGGVYFLFRRGKDLAKKEATAGTTNFAVPALGGTLTLPGTWITDPSVADTLRQLASDIAQNQPIRADVSARKGNARIGVVTAPASDPASYMEQNKVETAESKRQDDGSTVSVSPSRTLQIAQKPAMATEYESRSPAGVLLFKVRYYLIQGQEELVLIQTYATPDQADSAFTGIEQALLALN